MYRTDRAAGISVDDQHRHFLRLFRGLMTKFVLLQGSPPYSRPNALKTSSISRMSISAAGQSGKMWSCIGLILSIPPVQYNLQIDTVESPHYVPSIFWTIAPCPCGPNTPRRNSVHEMGRLAIIVFNTIFLREPHQRLGCRYDRRVGQHDTPYSTLLHPIYRLQRSNTKEKP